MDLRQRVWGEPPARAFRNRLAQGVWSAGYARRHCRRRRRDALPDGDAAGAAASYQKDRALCPWRLYSARSGNQTESGSHLLGARWRAAWIADRRARLHIDADGWKASEEMDHPSPEVTRADRETPGSGR